MPDADAKDRLDFVYIAPRFRPCALGIAGASDGE